VFDFLKDRTTQDKTKQHKIEQYTTNF